MTLKDWVIGGGVVLALAVGTIALNQPEPTNNVPDEEFGAFPGPEITEPAISINGLRTFAFKTSPRAATTTLCSFRAPAATTTISHAAFKVSATTTAMRLIIANATTPNATSTRLAAGYTTAGNRGAILATTTIDASIIEPSSYVNYQVMNADVGGGNVAGIAFSGACNLELKEL